MPLRTIMALALAVPAPGAGWGAPAFVENFDRLDTGKWMVYHSPTASENPRTGKAVSVSGGVLKITGGFYGGKDLSGGLATRKTQTYGRWEVRFRAEAGAGYTPVALLMASDRGEHAEIDFAEIIDPKRQGGGIFVHAGDERADKQLRADFTRWRTVAVDWLPGRLTFWLDGEKVWDYRGPHVPDGRAMGLALQHDVVCNQWSPCRGGSTPKTVSMYVDWVKIYRAPRS
ncbi:glycoside hydrolase family 16 protein [Nonomuraea sp. NPDC050310]|uniref:glycoside hydrolase family 16 protein n=1 Tax=unclassified Nonomuraea TaxID=2593643 RepID=UPI0033FC21E7